MCNTKAVTWGRGAEEGRRETRGGGREGGGEVALQGDAEEYLRNGCIEVRAVTGADGRKRGSGERAMGRKGHAGSR